jgi:hypothetical protein
MTRLYTINAREHIRNGVLVSLRAYAMTCHLSIVADEFRLALEPEWLLLGLKLYAGV